MAKFNPDFWEIPVSQDYLERRGNEEGLWHETAEARELRYAHEKLVQQLLPEIMKLIDCLTQKQQAVVNLCLQGKTQEEIANTLGVAQSTVSRHLSGTSRNGSKVGGAIKKLQGVIEKNDPPKIKEALKAYQETRAQAAHA